MADRPVPIAIVGMSCKFAGEATDPEKLWKICEERRSAWSRVPSSRFNLDGVYHPNGEKIDSTNVIGGHFLDDDIASFDAAFFGFPTDLAASFDPQFRMQLEGTYEALENAGLSMEDVAGSNTSVFAGAFFKDYHDTQFKDNQTLPRNVMLGVGSAMASNRLSHFFDLRGPSLSIDTGCSTTLVAFHQACQSLRCAESDMSIIGGANVILQPDNFVVMSTLKFLSPEGRSFAFDSRASGYGRGEGSGTIIIKRLDDAIRDGDNVRAVVLNSGSNQDGKTETITAPSQDAQEALIRSVYEKAGLDPAETGYFEAHGTGTPTGDPLEVGAISAVFSVAKSPQDPLRIGSVKSNIGHTETASGLASLIKTTLALEKGIVPPSATFETPNPVLRLEERNLVVPPTAEPWPEVNGVRRASVNNFGYGGTNAHVIMEGYESYVRRQANGSAPNSVLNGWHEHVTSRLIVLSAKEEQAALNMAKNLKVHLEDLDIANHEKYFDSLVYTLGQKRSRLPWTSAFPVDNVTDLIKILDGPRTKPRRTAAVTPKVGFVFTGQGAQWYAMGRELIEAYPVFKAAVLEAEEALRDVGCDWSLIDELSKDAENTRVNDIAYSTPLSVVVQIALIRLLSSWGVDPAAVTSHSSGEIPAAYAAGAITLRTAMAICFARGQLAGKKIAGVQPGGMIAVGLGPVAAQGYIDQITSGRVVIACYNSPSSITASGDVQGIEELENVLKAEGVFARRLKIDAAYHSHHMEALAEAYHTWLKTLMTEQDTLSSNVIFSSPTTGNRESCGKTISNPLHWVQSLTRPVAFVKAFTSMCLEDDKTKSSSVDIVVEVGPHAALSGPIQEIIGGEDFKGCDVEYFPTLVRKRSAIDTMQELAANLLKAGCKLDMEAINFPFGRKNAQLLQNLPRYPWNHSIRHWAEPRVSKAVRSRALPSHDLVGSLIPGTNSITPTWRHIIRLADIPWLRDHVVQSDILFPGAGFLCMAIEASAQLAVSEGKKPVGYRLRDVQIDRGLLIPDTLDASKSAELQLTLGRTDDKTIATPGWRAFRICSVTVDNEWTEHCSGLIDVESEAATSKIMAWQDPLSDVRVARHGQDAEYWKVMDPQDLYAAIRATGIDHGPIFQNIQTVHQRRNQSLASVKVADTAATMPCGHEAAHVIHPTTIDTIFQASYSAYLATPESGSKLSTPLVPRTIKSIELRADKLPKAGSMLKIYCDVTSASTNGFTSDMAIYENADSNKDEQPLLQINGFTVTAIGSAIEPRQSDIFDLEKLATVEWKKDITFLSKEQLRQELSSPFDAEEAAIMTDLSRVTFHYIRQALEQLNEQTVAQLEWYHEKYVTWMKLQVILAQQNELSPDSSTWFDDPPELVAKLTAKVKDTTVNGEMVCCLGPQIPAILRHEVTPLEAMMENKLLHRYYEDAIKWERTTCKLGQIVQHMTHKNPRMKILEIGAGTGGATKRILSAVGHQAASYDFTDISSGFFEEAQEVLSEYSDIVRYKRLDVEQDPAGQGFEEGSYDVIVACQVLHATKNMEHTMSNVRRLLKPGGRLCLMETTKDALDLLFVFGLLPGWWLSEEKERQWSPSLSVNMWDSVLQKIGFGGIEIEVHDCEDEEFYSFSVISATVPKEVEAGPANLDTLIVTGTENTPSSEWLGELQTLLAETTGNRPNIVPLDFASASCSGKICVFVGGDNALLDPTSEQFDAIKAATIQSKGLLWITSGAAIDSENPVAAMSVGYLRTIRSEYSGKRLVHLDLEPGNPWSADSLFNIVQVLSSVFEPSEEASDFEYAVRDGEVLIPRYIKDEARISRLFHQPSQTAAPVTTIEPFAQQGRPLRLDFGVPGLLDTIHFVDNPNAAKPLPEDYVEIAPKAFGINFRDVMTAMGQLESDITGLECSGVVKRVGPLAAARSNLRPGDRVAALLRGHFADNVSTNWTSVVPIPANMSFETAASIPLAFATSYISLVDMAHIQAGESVLIHSAAGGVGQAAVTIAQHIGAEVFVTVGSQGKREFMTEKYGIEEDHIFSSRDHSFAAGIMRMTNGRGVDVVLNSLAGSLLQKSLNCVARFGRFVEIGKRDLEGNSKLEMEVFKRQVAFSSVDLLQMEEFRGEWVQRALKSLMHLLRNGNIVPNEPIVSYPLAEVEKPFRLMQAGKHMGKFVLTVRPDEMVPVGQRKLKASLRPDASYLIVGGLGGIGRSICHWMADKGAKNIIVMSRSAGSSNKSNEVTEEMRKLGVKLLPVSCDVSDPLALTRAVEESGRIMPPVRGVVQAAMVLSDSILEKMTLDAWLTATRPKVHGSLNLHKQFSSPEVDFFIMLSSLSGVTGFVSQSNYAAGNTFQDALARHRVCSGLHGASIDTGIVNSVGYLIEHKEQMERLRKQQYHVLSETDVLSVIEEAIVSKPDRQMLLGLNGANLDDPTEARFWSLPWRAKTSDGVTNGAGAGKASSTNSAGDLAGVLSCAETFADAVDAVRKSIVAKLMDIFMIEEADIDPKRSVSDLGVDSLVAVELRNLLALRAGAKVSIFDIMSSTSLNAFAENITMKSSFVDAGIITSRAN